MFGGNREDSLHGGIGADVIWGEADADALFGNSGADWLSGGAGRDRLSGGAGADIFVFNSGPLSSTNTDRIVDFLAIDDSIQLENAIFKAFTYTGLIRAENLVLGAQALDGNDFLIYQSSTGSLWYDPDGSGALAKVLIADFIDGTSLTRADVFLI